jgi:hypothetical protein
MLNFDLYCSYSPIALVAITLAMIVPPIKYWRKAPNIFLTISGTAKPRILVTCKAQNVGAMAYGKALQRS